MGYLNVEKPAELFCHCDADRRLSERQHAQAARRLRLGARAALAQSRASEAREATGLEFIRVGCVAVLGILLARVLGSLRAEEGGMMEIFLVANL